ncbi:hypothetical protein PUR49_20395, partial [Streptomyces sp. BE147]|uniref:hypothetical protein n=1 Tax=Streptomyces sp. BE147 TaxID=3002524 RepID=UPI002E771F24
GQTFFAFQFFAFAFPFPASPTLPDSFPFRFRSEFDSSGLRMAFAFRLIRPYQKHLSRNNQLK